MKDRARRIRKEIVEYLGGKCVQCQSVEELQADHIDKATKKFSIASAYSKNSKELWEEVAKCQLLCACCHEAKTLVDMNQQSAKTTHGTLSSYRYCKCDLCRAAKAEYNKNYQK